jgi:hypothetical protein
MFAGPVLGITLIGVIAGSSAHPTPDLSGSHELVDLDT